MSEEMKEEKKIDPQKKRQNDAIKQRLADYYRKIDENTRPSIYALQKLLAEKENQSWGFEVSYNTINDLLKPTPTEKAPNLYAVLGLCRLWNLDYAEIFAPPESDVKVVPRADALVAKTEILDKFGYKGKFYGYMYSKNVNRSDIVEFELEIKDIANTVQAVLKVKTFTDKTDGEVVPSVIEYKGTPLLITNKSVIAITLVNDKGGFYSFYFKYREYNNLGLYYRKGISVTTDSETDKLILENFVLFENQVSKDKRNRLIPGLLPFIDDSFIITQKDLEELMKDEKIKSFVEDYSYNWQSKDKMMSCIKIPQILSSMEDKSDEQERYRILDALIVMMKKAQEPVRIIYENPEGMPGFAKKVIQRNPKKAKEE